MLDNSRGLRTNRVLPFFLTFLILAASVVRSESWSISSATVLPGGEPANRHIRELLDKLASERGEGVPVSGTEFSAYCDESDPRVDLNALMKYADPKSIERQNFDHAAYRSKLMREGRLEAGADFLRAHDKLLRRAQGRYGVARQDIVSILMWESNLGRIVGDTPVFNVLLAQLLYLEEARHTVVAEMKMPGAGDASPGLLPHERKRFEKLKNRAVINLAALLRLSKAKGQDPTAPQGSWAGAIGYPQFMPASLKYAVDGDGDGVIDLNHWPDVIFSVANYLREHGYDMSYRGRKRGIHRYNPIDSYVHGVIAYADAIVRR